MNERFHNCGYDQFTEKKVEEVFNINGKLYLVKNITALECNRCGERYFKPEVQRETMRILKDSSLIKEKIEAEVYEYS